MCCVGSKRVGFWCRSGAQQQQARISWSVFSSSPWSSSLRTSSSSGPPTPPRPTSSRGGVARLLPVVVDVVVVDSAISILISLRLVVLLEFDVDIDIDIALDTDALPPLIIIVSSPFPAHSLPLHRQSSSPHSSSPPPTSSKHPSPQHSVKLSTAPPRAQHSGRLLLVHSPHASSSSALGVGCISQPTKVALGQVGPPSQGGEAEESEGESKQEGSSQQKGNSIGVGIGIGIGGAGREVGV